MCLLGGSGIPAKVGGRYSGSFRQWRGQWWWSRGAPSGQREVLYRVDP